MVVVIDGMHLLVPAPSRSKQNDLKAMYNGKHKCWATMVLVIVDLRGHLLFVSEPYAKTEGQVLHDVGVKEMIKKARIGIIGDALYNFNRVTDDKADNIHCAWTIGPTTLRRVGELLHVDDRSLVPQNIVDEMRRVIDSTSLASQLRIVVENSIRRLRCWKILNDCFRARGSWQAENGKYSLLQCDVVKVVAWLCQRQLLLKPCRSADWAPSGVASGKKYDYLQADNKRPLNAKQQEKRVTSLFEDFSRLKAEKEAKDRVHKRKTRSKTTWLDEVDTEDLAPLLSSYNTQHKSQRRTTSRQRGEKRAVKETLRAANERLEDVERKRRKRIKK